MYISTRFVHSLHSVAIILLLSLERAFQASHLPQMGNLQSQPQTTSPASPVSANYSDELTFSDSVSSELEEILLTHMIQEKEVENKDVENNSNGISAAIFWWTPWQSKLTGSSNAGRLDISPNSTGSSSQQVRSKRSIHSRLKRAKTTKHEIRRCSEHTFEKCLFMMQEVMQNSSLAFPTSGEDLETTCKKLKAGDYCAEKYIRSCANDQERLLYQDIVQGTKNVIRLICQQGETQQLYLEFASCFKDIFVSELKCSTVLNRFQEISKLRSTEPPPPGNELGSAKKLEIEERLKQFCCAYRDFVDCQLKNVRKFCGTKGLEFFERKMGEMTNSLINEHCVGYTFQDKCRPYQEDLIKDSLETENPNEPGKTGGKRNQNRVKSMLVHGASANGAASSLYWLTTSTNRFSWPFFGWLSLPLEMISKMVVSVTISATINWARN